MRHLIIEDTTEIPFAKVVKGIKLKHNVKSMEGEVFKCGLKKVKIRTSPHKKNNPDVVETTLIVCKYKKKNKEYKDGLFYLYCNFDMTNLTEAEVIEKALNGYRCRWKIEEFHREVKSDFGLEKIQLMSYKGLQNLNAILMLVVQFLYSTENIFEELAVICPEYISKKLLKNKKKRFIYYSLFNAVQYLFRQRQTYNKRKRKRREVDDLQMCVSFE